MPLLFSNDLAAHDDDEVDRVRHQWGWRGGGGLLAISKRGIGKTIIITTRRGMDLWGKIIARLTARLTIIIIGLLLQPDLFEFECPEDVREHNTLKDRND